MEFDAIPSSDIEQIKRKTTGKFITTVISAAVIVDIFSGNNIELHDYFFLYRFLQDNVAIEIDDSLVALSF